MTENLLVSAGLFIGGLSFAWWQIRRGSHGDRRRRIPAAPDNQAGTNTSDLWTCRHIANATNHARKEDR